MKLIKMHHAYALSRKLHYFEVDCLGEIDTGTRIVLTDKQKERVEAGKRLQQARVLAGHETASEAANHLNINNRTYTQYENGKRGYKSKVLLFSEAFGVSPEWLLNGDNKADQSPAQSGSMATENVDSPALQMQLLIDNFVDKLNFDEEGNPYKKQVLDMCFAAAMDFDKSTLGGKGSIADVIQIAENIYKIAIVKASKK